MVLSFAFMNGSSSSSNGHSASVLMTLKVGKTSVPVGQMGPDFLILREALDTPPCAGLVVLEIDGVKEEIPVDLPRGSYRGSNRVAIAELAESVSR